MAGTGISYFPIMCQLDDKFELLEAEFGLKGFAVVVKLLQRIYGENGYYCDWTKEVELLFTRKLGLSIGDNSVSEIVKSATKRGIFNQDIYSKYGVLTSKGIQKRYLEITSRRKKVELKNEYLLIPYTQIPSNVCIIEENDNILNNIDYIFEQRKGKESKVKESKVKEREEETSPPHSSILGSFNNVQLSEEQLNELLNAYENCNELINKVSEYLANATKTYKNHYALICKIAREDKWAKKKKVVGEIETKPIESVPMPDDLRKKMGLCFKSLEVE